jgi:hypothetical protein
MNTPVKMQTVGEATSSIKGVIESTFSSLANSLKLPQLRDSFFQNIIYILIVIVILVGILVYIQMVGSTSINPLNLPPSKEIKKIEIQKVVEGFDIEQNGGFEDSATNIELDEYNADGQGNNLYEDPYDNNYEDLTEVSSNVSNNDRRKK